MESQILLHGPGGEENLAITRHHKQEPAQRL